MSAPCPNMASLDTACPTALTLRIAASHLWLSFYDAFCHGAAREMARTGTVAWKQAHTTAQMIPDRETGGTI